MKDVHYHVAGSNNAISRGYDIITVSIYHLFDINILSLLMLNANIVVIYAILIHNVHYILGIRLSTGMLVKRPKPQAAYSFFQRLFIIV